MSLKVTFQLTDADLRHFRVALRNARAETGSLSEIQVIQAADATLRKVDERRLPDFVRDRLAHVRLLIDMLLDKNWQLPTPERKRVHNVLAYFAQGDDIVADNVPVLGFLDDAIMLELIRREIAEEVRAFEEFRRFRSRDSGQTSTELRKRRNRLLERMRRRRARRAAGESGPRPRLF